MRHCIVHVGIHKTGSTAIQRSLGLHRTNLERTGILYPDLPGESRRARGQHGLAAALGIGERGGEPAFTLADLENALAETKAEYVVVSSESLSVPGIRPERIADFIGAITRHGFDVTVVAFVRPQAALVNSGYVQQVQTFHLDEAFDGYVGRVIDTAHYRMTERLSGWSRQPGVRFVVVPYTGRVIGPRIAETLLEAGGIPGERIAAAGLGAAESANVSAGNMAIAACRMVRRLHPEIADHPRRARVQNYAMTLAEERGWMREKFVGLDQARADAIRDRFAEDNEVFARRFMDRPWHEAFAEDYAKPWRRNEVDPDLVTPEIRDQFTDFARLVSLWSPDAEAKPVRRARADGR